MSPVDGIKDLKLFGPVVQQPQSWYLPLLAGSNLVVENIRFTGVGNDDAWCET